MSGSAMCMESPRAALPLETMRYSLCIFMKRSVMVVLSFLFKDWKVRLMSCSLKKFNAYSSFQYTIFSLLFSFYYRPFEPFPPYYSNTSSFVPIAYSKQHWFQYDSLIHAWAFYRHLGSVTSQRSKVAEQLRKYASLRYL